MLEWIISMSIKYQVQAGVISNGTQGVDPSLLKFLFILGAQPLINFYADLAFHSGLTLL